MNASLETWRIEAGLSKRLAARVLNVRPEFYARLEAGQETCGPALAMRIAEATHWAVSPDDLAGGTAEPIPPAVVGRRGAAEAEGVDAAAEGGAVQEPPPSVGPMTWDVTVFPRPDLNNVVELRIRDGDTVTVHHIQPEDAGALGVGLIRAALAATAPVRAKR